MAEPLEMVGISPFFTWLLKRKNFTTINCFPNQIYIVSAAPIKPKIEHNTISNYMPKSHDAYAIWSMSLNFKFGQMFIHISKTEYVIFIQFSGCKDNLNVILT